MPSAKDYILDLPATERGAILSELLQGENSHPFTIPASQLIREIPLQIPCSQRKQFLLMFSLDTDNDAAVTFEGQTYCQGGPNLVITRGFRYRQSAIDFIQSKVKVVSGGKASKHVSHMLTSGLSHLKKHPLYHQGGNQELNIWLSSTTI
jgi:hypothetical protein